MTILYPEPPPMLPKLNVPTPAEVATWTGTDSGQAVPAQSPLWWVRRLHKQLRDRAAMIAVFDNYYSGNHPVPWLPENQREDFRHLLALTGSNYMGLVVDTPVQRMHVEGFRFDGSEEGDAEAWRVWQANNLDAGSQQAFLEAFIGGLSCWLVDPTVITDDIPTITVEHGSQAIVEHVPGSNRRKRAAALKVWTDDWTGLINATLYLPDFLWKMQAKPSNSGSADLRWGPREVPGEEWPAPNPLGVVSMVEMPNRPRLLTGGVSELVDVVVIQDRINKTIADRLMTQDFGAFPQKWVKGYEVETDEVTGQPIKPFKLGRDRLLVAESDSSEFGQFLPAPLDPYSQAKNEDVKDIASRTQTPAQYLLGEIVNISAEALKAAESGLVSKILNRREPFADAMEDVMRLAFLAKGDDARANDTAAETIWADPEFRLEAQIVDAAVKKDTLGVPREQLYEDMGYSQTQIARFRDAQSTAQVANVQAQLDLAQKLQDEQGLSQPAAFATVGLFQAANAMQGIPPTQQ